MLNALAAAYAEVGRYSSAVSAQEEALKLVRNEGEKRAFNSRLKSYESGSPLRDPDLSVGEIRALLLGGRPAEAERLARACLKLREEQSPDDWQTFGARSMLGGILLVQKKHAEAEPLLLSGYEGMKQREADIPAAGKPPLQETLQRLVQLYDATGRASQATQWKQKLAEFEKPDAEKQATKPPR